MLINQSNTDNNSKKITKDEFFYRSRRTLQRQNGMCRFQLEIVKSSLKDTDHPLNDLIRNNSTSIFVPYVNERNTMGRLIKN
jgi:hypothetical protein